jgi:hypothetical protein
MEKRSVMKEEILHGGEGAFMKTPIHLKRHGDSYFHLHPLHAVFSLMASFVLAVLIMLMLVGNQPDQLWLVKTRRSLVFSL